MPAEGVARVRGRRAAWLILTCSLLFHALDELHYDFAAEYNAALAQLQQRWEWLPLTPVDPQAMSLLLLFATGGLLATIPWIGPDRAWARLVSLNYGILLAANGVGHLLFSLMAGRALAGATTSVLIVAAAGWLLTVEFRALGSGA